MLSLDLDQCGECVLWGVTPAVARAVMLKRTMSLQPCGTGHDAVFPVYPSYPHVISSKGAITKQ